MFFIARMTHTVSIYIKMKKTVAFSDILLRMKNSSRIQYVKIKYFESGD